MSLFRFQGRSRKYSCTPILELRLKNGYFWNCPIRGVLAALTATMPEQARERGTIYGAGKGHPDLGCLGPRHIWESPKIMGTLLASP